MFNYLVNHAIIIAMALNIVALIAMTFAHVELRKALRLIDTLSASRISKQKR